MRTRILSAALVAIIVAGDVCAAERPKIRALNISVQTIFTLVSAGIQGKLGTRPDRIRCLVSGLVAGYGFYEAKSSASRGHVREAWILANASSSIAANAAAGRHPLGRVRWTVGPLRAEVSTPLERQRTELINFSVSPANAVALGLMWQKSDRIHWRDGLITFSKEGKYRFEGGDYEGFTSGIYPGIMDGADPKIWNHEVIHAVQNLQIGSIDPPLCTFRRRGCPTARPHRVIRFETLDVPLFQGGNALLGIGQDYEDRWTEIEAYRLAQNIEPVIVPPSPPR